MKIGMFTMRKNVISYVAYPTTGVGIYHTFFGNSKLLGSIILIVGLIGIIYDIFTNISNNK